MTEKEIGTIIVDAAIEVHRQLGPGLLETVYEAILAHELSAKGFKAQRRVAIEIKYKSMTFDEAFRANFSRKAKSSSSSNPSNCSATPTLNNSRPISASPVSSSAISSTSAPPF